VGGAEELNRNSGADGGANGILTLKTPGGGGGKAKVDVDADDEEENASSWLVLVAVVVPEVTPAP